MTFTSQTIAIAICCVVSLSAFVIALVVAVRVRGLEKPPARFTLKLGPDSRPVVVGLHHDGGLGVSTSGVSASWTTQTSGTSFENAHVIVSLPMRVRTTLLNRKSTEVTVSAWKLDGTMVPTAHEVQGYVDAAGLIHVGHTSGESLADTYLTVRVWV
jgi:hypothetical protein